MRKNKYVPVKTNLTDEQKARRDAALAWAEENRDAIIARGRKVRRRSEARRAVLREAFALLKAERERQSLSLSDLEARTGISKPALSRLENAQGMNATVSTLCRVAEALGKTLHVVLD